MGTFSAIQARVRTIIIDLPAAVTAQVPALVNSAMQKIQQDHNFKVMDRAQNYATTVGSHSLTPATVPTTFKEFHGSPRLIRFDGSKKPLLLAPNRASLNLAFQDDDIGEPEVLHDGTVIDDNATRSLFVWPIPDGNSDYAGGEYQIVLAYWGYVAPLAADAASNWFTTNAEDYLVFQAAYEGFMMDWDYQGAAVWAAKAEIEKRRIIKTDKLYRLSTTDVLVPHWRGQYEPALPR